MIVTVALNHDLETEFRSGTPVTTWYIGLIDSSGYTAVATADTMSSHAGWTEITDYSESTRVAWSPGAAAAGVIVNGTLASFTFTAAKTVKGLFLTSVSTKGGTTGTLFLTALADTEMAMTSGEVLKVQLTLTAAAGVGS